MTEIELANILKEMYESGIQSKEQTTIIHLFGIKYAEIIRSNGFIPKDF